MFKEASDQAQYSPVVARLLINFPHLPLHSNQVSVPLLSRSLRAFCCALTSLIGTLANFISSLGFSDSVRDMLEGLDFPDK